MKKQHLLLVLTIILVATISIFFFKKSGNTDSGTLKVGAILPLSGQLDFLGVPQSSALQIAVSETKHRGQLIELHLEDNKGDATTAVTAAKKLIEINKIDIGFVTTSAISRAVTPVFQQAGIPLITICSDEGLAAENPMVTNFYVGIDDEIKLLAGYWMGHNIKQLSFLRVDASVTETAVRQVRQQYPELQIINDNTYKLSETPQQSIISGIVSSRPEALVILGYGPEFPSVIQRIRESGFSGKIFGNYSMASLAARKNGTSVFQNCYFASFPITPLQLSQSPFGKKYFDLTGSSPSQFLDYVFAYEALTQVVNFWSSHPQELGAFPSYIRGKRFETLFGPVTIDTSGNGSAEMKLSYYDSTGNIQIAQDKDPH